MITFAACKSSYILEHFLSSVAEAGSLDAYAGECAAELIDKDCGKSLALNVLSDNNELLTRFYDLLKKRKNFLNV